MESGFDTCVDLFYLFIFLLKIAFEINAALPIFDAPHLKQIFLNVKSTDVSEGRTQREGSTVK